VFQHAYTLLLTLFGMVIGNASGLAHIGEYYAAMFGFGSGYYGGAWFLLGEYKAELFCAALFSMPVAKIAGDWLSRRPLGEALRLTAFLAVFALSSIAIIYTSFNPFIYFRF
jgi:alginate O-acetyltransferase complex protein AlgI